MIQVETLMQIHLVDCAAPEMIDDEAVMADLNRTRKTAEPKDRVPVGPKARPPVKKARRPIRLDE